jgi:hypothetical protein
LSEQGEGSAQTHLSKLVEGGSLFVVQLVEDHSGVTYEEQQQSER